MKVCIWFLLWVTFVLSGVSSIVFAADSYVETIGADFPFWPQPPDSKQWADALDVGKVIKETAIDPTNSASEKIQKALWVDYDAGIAKDQRATYFIKQLINWFLAIIGLVAVWVLVYGFYQMFLAKDNAEAFTEAMSIVKWALLALAVIGISRYIVSILFDIFFTVKEDIS